MIDFLQTYYREIIYIAAFIIELFVGIFLLIKKSKKEPSIVSKILIKLPELISAAEVKYGASSGPLKKSSVMAVISSILSIYGLKEDKYLLDLFDEEIEKILSTPTKKGESNEK